MDGVIDWSLAAQVARGVARLQPAGDPEPFEPLDGPAEESERLVSAYTGLVPTAPLPRRRGRRPRRVDRRQPRLAARRAGPGRRPARRRARRRSAASSRTAGGALLAAEAGAISGFLAGRVLGQYEFPVLDPAAPARLLFVAPNLGHAATALDADADQLLRWVALHETTHALQFGGVPWLREHLAGTVAASCSARHVGRRRASCSGSPTSTTSAGSSTASARAGSPRSRSARSGASCSTACRRFMAVLEGYAEHVMDAVGAELLDDLAELRARAEPPPARALRLPARARAPDRHGPQAAPVRAGQGVLRRASSPAAGSRRSTASGLAPRRCRRSPSSTTAGHGWLGRAPTPAGLRSGRTLTPAPL